ncbi:MAG: T9SS type A sorting domain-containing protein, partial [Bacteroidota bacterium]|nr:T9SS type A sorting domain-containing protein [Bacteroidota bacterium]
GYIPEIYKDSLTTFHAFQPLYGGGLQDVALIRTRAPGCAVLACSVDMADTVHISHEPSWISPEHLLVDVEVANVDPVRSAGDVECVLTLPPGLVLDPATQSLRQSLSGTIAPGTTEHFTWTVRVDTASLVLAADSGVWIDVVTYYKDGDLPREGAPAALPCAHYLRFVRTERYEPLLACAVEAPDSVFVNGSEDNYLPQPFTVHFSTKNTGTAAVDFARFGVYVGGDIGGLPVPSNAKYFPGMTLPPGETHALTWQLRAERRAEDRTMRVLVAGEDVLGNALTFCETEVFVPGLPSPQCRPLGPTTVHVDPESGLHDPDPLIAQLALGQVLDTTLQDCAGEIDLSGCRYLSLGGGTPRQRSGAMSADQSDTLSWQLTLPTIPAITSYDTIVYRTYSAGVLRSSCLQVVRILPLAEQLRCTLLGPDSLKPSELLARTPVALSHTLRNTGTVPVTVGRIVLTIPADSDLRADEALAQPGRVLAPSEALTFDWTLRARILHSHRDVPLVVSAYDEADSLLSSCMHALHVPGIAPLTCMVAAADTVRFDRSVPSYDPDPLQVTVDLRSLLDTTVTGIEARIDLSLAARLALVAGEAAVKSIALLDSHATGGLTWQLVPQSAPMADDQEVVVRYRSDQQTEWRQCSALLHIEAWPEETAIACSIGGHDSLYADPHYERYIPDPLHVSYTVTNTGTVALTGCEVSIIPPQGFVLTDADSNQLFTAPAYANQSGGPVPPGTLLPNATCTRWWSISPTGTPGNSGPAEIRWRWRSDQQGNEDGCEASIHVIPDAPVGVAVVPLHLYFEAERGGALPAGQRVQIWTGGGLDMPWTLQPSEWWLNTQPLSGSQSASVVVQPTSSMLEIGAHGAVVQLAAAPSDHRIAVTYVMRKSTGADEPPAPAALSIETWPQPVQANGVLRIRIDDAHGSRYQLTLHDFLGRSFVTREVGPGETVRVHAAESQLGPGIYLLRARSNDGQSVSRLITVLR